MIHLRRSAFYTRWRKQNRDATLDADAKMSSQSGPPTLSLAGGSIETVLLDQGASLREWFDEDGTDILGSLFFRNSFRKGKTNSESSFADYSRWISALGKVAWGTPGRLAGLAVLFWRRWRVTGCQGAARRLGRSNGPDGMLLSCHSVVPDPTENDSNLQGK